MNVFEKNWLITEAMIRYGGGFVRKLGSLYRKGDLSNQRKLRTAFEEYWLRYEKLIPKVQEEIKKEEEVG